MEEEIIEKKEFLFGKKNYLIMLVGIVFIALGFVFMAGGGSDSKSKKIIYESYRNNHFSGN